MVMCLSLLATFATSGECNGVVASSSCLSWWAGLTAAAADGDTAASARAIPAMKGLPYMGHLASWEVGAAAPPRYCNHPNADPGRRRPGPHPAQRRLKRCPSDATCRSRDG